MTMYFPTHVVTGAGSAYVFLLYVIQLVWTILGAAVFLVGDRKALSQLSHTPGLGNEDPEGPNPLQGVLGTSDAPPSIDQRRAANS
jgi:hypothetical protein